MFDLGIKLVQLRIEEAALKRESDAATKERLEELVREIAERLAQDRGDLAADIAGYSFGAAVKGAQWLDHGMP